MLYKFDVALSLEDKQHDGFGSAIDRKKYVTHKIADELSEKILERLSLQSETIHDREIYTGSIAVVHGDSIGEIKQALQKLLEQATTEEQKRLLQTIHHQIIY